MKEKEFLKEYELLCQKYKMGLCGCGCCGSPYLNEIDDINYDYELNKIIINHKTIDNYFKEVNNERKLIKNNQSL